MAIVAFDTFTDTPGTDLVNHTPDSGGAWEEHGVDNAGQAVISNENRARGNASATVSLLHTVAPPSADYSVRGTMHVKSVAGACGLVARSQSDEQTAVTLGYNAIAGAWVLAELVEGVIGEARFIPGTLDEDTDYELELVVEGDTVAGYVDGELLASIKTEVLDAGRAGLSFLGGSDSTGLHIDDWGIEVAAAMIESATAIEADVAAALRATRRIAASLECETDADIEAAIARVLASVAQVDPDVVPVLRPARLAAACVQAEADVLGELAVEKIIRLAAVLEAEGAVTGGLRVARELAAVVDAEVVADAAPEVRRLLATQLAADADAAVPLHVARALAAALEADVDASAALFLATLLITTLSVQVAGAGRSAMARELAGPALARAVRGPALSRAVRGPALRRFEIQGPAAS